MMWFTLFCSVPLGLRGVTIPWQPERARSRTTDAAKPKIRGILFRFIIPRLGPKTPPLRHRAGVVETLLFQMFPEGVVLSVEPRFQAMRFSADETCAPPARVACACASPPVDSVRGR